MTKVQLYLRISRLFIDVVNKLQTNDYQKKEKLQNMISDLVFYVGDWLDENDTKDLIEYVRFGEKNKIEF